MPISTIAPKGKFGSTNYYVTSMTVQVLRIMRTAIDSDVWSEESIDERLQREPNWNRIQKQIAYLANNKDKVLWIDYSSCSWI